MFIDAHLHVTDPLFDDGYDDISDSEFLFSNTSNPSEYSRLEGISGNDEKIVPFYGTHPWYFSQYDEDTLEKIIKKNPKSNIGEIGLDTKKGNIQEQLPVFISQLKLASRYHRIVSIHMVGSEEQILDSLRKYNVTAILHSYASPENYIKAFAKCGCFFSISPRIFSKPSDKVKSILNTIPNDRILLESDAPSNHNNCFSMCEHASNVANAIGIKTEELLRLTTENGRKIISSLLQQNH